MVAVTDRVGANSCDMAFDQVDLIKDKILRNNWGLNSGRRKKFQHYVTEWQCSMDPS